MNFTFRSHVLAVLFLCCLGCAVHLNTVHVPFQFDDQVYISESFPVKTFKKVQDLWFHRDTSKRWVGSLTFALNYKFGGMNVVGYHIVNICTHLLNGLLVYWLLWQVLSSPEAQKHQEGSWHQNKGWLACVGAALFLIHPVQTQAVAYICQRLTSMAAFFYLLAVCLYWKLRIHQRPVDGVLKWGCAAGILACSILGFFTKENFITFPAMLLLIEVYFRPDFSKKKLFFWAAAIMAVLAGAYVIYPHGFEEIFAAHLEQGITWKNYLLTQFRVLMTYLRLIVLPVHQNLDYDYPLSQSLFEVPTMLSFLALVAVFVTAVRFFKKHRLLSFGIAWFFLTLSVESTFIPLRDVIFEHRLYLPLAGAVLFASVCFGNICRRKKYLILFSAVMVGVLSWMAYQRNLVWHSEVSLWEDTLRKSPRKARPHINLGMGYYYEKEYAKALAVLNRAIEIEPNHFLAYMSRANVYKAMREYSRAREDYKKAKSLNTNYATIYYNWGNLLFELKQFAVAANLYSTAVFWRPEYDLAYFGLGNALKAQKKYDEAVKYYELAESFGGPKGEIRNNLGNVYRETGKYDQALMQYSRAIEEKPDLIEAYNNRASVYHLKNEYDLALEDFSHALKLDPNFFQSYFNRGNLFVALERWSGAIDDYTEAIRLSGLPEAYLNRALVYRTQGEYEKAIADFSHIVEVFPQSPEIYWQRALCYQAVGEKLLALKDFLKARGLGFPVTDEVIEGLKKETDPQ